MYYETHHIIPRAMGGTDEKENLVNLTAYEHFVVHWLLPNMCKNSQDKYKMVKSMLLMEGKNDPKHLNQTAKMFEETKNAIAISSSIQNKGKKRSQEFVDNLSEAMSGEGNVMYGKTHEASSIALMSNKKKGANNPASIKAEKNDKGPPLTKTRDTFHKNPIIRAKNSITGEIELIYNKNNFCFDNQLSLRKLGRALADGTLFGNYYVEKIPLQRSEKQIAQDKLAKSRNKFYNQLYRITSKDGFEVIMKVRDFCSAYNYKVTTFRKAVKSGKASAGYTIEEYNT